MSIDSGAVAMVDKTLGGPSLSSGPEGTRIPLSRVLLVVACLLERKGDIGGARETRFPNPRFFLPLGTGERHVHPASGAEDLMQKVLIANLGEPQNVLG